MADEEKRDDNWSDENQSKIEFILHQQARFAANIEVHEERLTRLENIVTRLATVTLEGQEKLNALADAQIKTEGSITKLATNTDEKLAALLESQAHTDKRLDALIDIVREERERRNGRHDKS
jgi:hypothetical protein